MGKAAGIADAGIKFDHVHWYLTHYTPFIPQQDVLSKQILSKTPKELQFVERSVFKKEANNQNLRNFLLGSQETNNVPILIGFQHRDSQESQNLNNDYLLKITTFQELPVTSAQCVIGTEK